MFVVASSQVALYAHGLLRLRELDVYSEDRGDRIKRTRMMALMFPMHFVLLEQVWREYGPNVQTCVR